MRYNDAVAAFERAAWLARAHDNDDAAQQARHGNGRCFCGIGAAFFSDAAAPQEYEAAAMAAKTASMTRGPRRGEARDGF